MKTATQVKDHIKNMARDKKINPLVLMKNYMMEKISHRDMAVFYFSDFDKVKTEE